MEPVVGDSSGQLLDAVVEAALSEEGFHFEHLAEHVPVQTELHFLELQVYLALGVLAFRILFDWGHGALILEPKCELVKNRKVDFLTLVSLVNQEHFVIAVVVQNLDVRDLHVKRIKRYFFLRRLRWRFLLELLAIQVLFYTLVSDLIHQQPASHVQKQIKRPLRVLHSLRKQILVNDHFGTRYVHVQV